MAGEDPFEESTPPRQAAPETVGKTLLDLDEETCVATLIRDWEQSRKYINRQLAQWQVNRLRDLGYTGVSLIKVQDENRAYLPPGATTSRAVMNKAARLNDRVRSTLFADPPIPEASPATDTDEDRDSAELATRVLQDIGSEGKMDYPLKAADAFELGGIYGSGFIEFTVDEYKGGWQPQEVLVHPTATDLTALTPENEAIDPTTGLVTTEVVTKYVKQDQTLTDNRADPAIVKVWLPGIDDEVQTGKNVRFLPSTARDIWEAEGVMIGRMVPWGSLKARIPKLTKLPPDDVAKIMAGKPQQTQDLLPVGRRQVSDPTSEFSDETLVFCLKRYHRSCATYPTGFYALVLGDSYLCERGEWYDTGASQPLDIPLTQFMHLREEENAYGKGMLEALGPGQEARAVVQGSMWDHLKRFTERKRYVPTTSNVQAIQAQAPMATDIPIIPGTQPFYEEVPEFPRAVEKMNDDLERDMDDESRLQQTAQGLSPSNVKSGLHAQQILEQVNVLLSDLKQNTERGLVRGWRIILQLTRAYYTRPQQVKWAGDDGAFKIGQFTGADLGSTADVRIMKGSFTGLAPSAKAALAQNFAQMGILDPDDLQHVVAGNVGGLLGVQDNPHRLRVRRQIGMWNEGPPENWQPPQAPIDAMGQPVIDPMTGQPAPPPPDPVLAGVFAPLDVDEEPDVAKLRAYELGRALASTKFRRWPEPWQNGMRAEYVRMRQAAGILTVQEQQQAAQQNAEAQRQAKAEDTAQKAATAEGQSQDKAADRELKRDVAGLQAKVKMANPLSPVM